MNEVYNFENHLTSAKIEPTVSNESVYPSNRRAADVTFTNIDLLVLNIPLIPTS